VIYSGLGLGGGGGGGLKLKTMNNLGFSNLLIIPNLL